MTFEEKLKEAKRLVAVSQKSDGCLNFASSISDVSYISTGIEALDQLTGSYSAGADPSYLGYGGIPNAKYTLIWGAQSVGKAQPLDAPVLTPYGWKPIGELVSGDAVINPAGGAAIVLATCPQGIRPIYKVSFSDGTTVECDKEHLWAINGCRREDAAWLVKPLSAIIEAQQKYSTAYEQFIPVTNAVTFAPREDILPIDPYVLGVLLGDGGFTQGTTILTNSDEYIIQEVQKRVPDAITLSKCGACGWRLSGVHTGGQQQNVITKALRELGLHGLYSYEKFVPDCYLYASIQKRLLLLQGLMDTDGTISMDTPTPTYTSTSEVLAEAVCTLVRSLGGTASITSRYTYYEYKDTKKLGKKSWRVSIQPPEGISMFRLPRKADKYRRNPTYKLRKRITDISFIGNKEAVCIVLDSAEQLYLTSGYTVTHNSTLVDRITARAQQQGKLCLVIDAEARRVPGWMRTQGVDLDTLLWHRGGIMEDSLQDMIRLLEIVDFAVVDTVHALAAQADTQTGKGKERTLMDTPPQARQASTLSRFFRVATNQVAKAGTSIVLVGQARDKTVNQQVMLECVGGHALQHYVTLKLRLSKLTDKNKVPKKNVLAPDGQTIQVPIGFIQKIKLEKAGTNHRENQTIEIPFLYGIGPNDFESNIMAAVGMGVIVSPSAGRFEVPTSSGEVVKIHGRDKLIQFFYDQKEYYDWLMDNITRGYDVEKDGESTKTPPSEAGVPGEDKKPARKRKKAKAKSASADETTK